MPDFEISVSPPSQHAAALHTNPRYSEAEEDHRDAERTDDERPVEPPSPMPMLREGLPAAYRMRHAPHYVEQLMGEARSRPSGRSPSTRSILGVPSQ
ncbi:MAG: hypothetical protein M3545_04905 [Acidobacteriota bacterium]|nr:hypothetical protein [Acidobacteriota bacterium]